MHRNQIKTRSRWWINCFGEQGWRSIKKEVTSDLSFSLVLTLIRGFFSRSEGFSLSTTSTLWIPIRHGNIRQESYLVECPRPYFIVKKEALIFWTNHKAKLSKTKVILNQFRHSIKNRPGVNSTLTAEDTVVWNLIWACLYWGVHITSHFILIMLT